MRSSVGIRAPEWRPTGYENDVHLRECLTGPDSDGGPSPEELEKLFLTLA